MKSLVYQNLNHIVTQLCNQFKIATQTPAIGRPKKISDRQAITLSLYQHHTTRATKKSVWDDFKEELKCSYKTLVVAMNRAAVPVLHLLLILMRLGKKYSHVIKYTDATDLPVCLKKNADDHKTMRGLAELGKSSKGWFYGLKLTITRDHVGRLLALRITPPGTNDRDIFRSINRDLFGLFIADAGYVSKELERNMYIEGRRWTLIRPYKSMKKLATLEQLKLYEGRFRIEFDFRNLKLFHGLVTSLPRSVTGYLANYFHALLSFMLA